MIHKIRNYEGIHRIPTYIEDNTPLSPNYFDITYLPKNLHAGKNIIRLKGNDLTLKPETGIFIELLDYNGNPIYHEIADFAYEDNSRIIVFYIYEDTPPGEATLTILAEATVDIDGNPIPREYTNIPNVKWQTVFSVDNTQRNNTEIIFSNSSTPDISISEKIRPYLTRDFELTQFVTQSAGTIDYNLSGNNPTITISGDRFRREHIGAVVKITPNNAEPSLNINVDDSTFWAKIKSLPTTSSAVLSSKYYLKANDSTLTYTANRLTNCSYEIHYQALPEFTSTQNLRSLGYIQINNIEPKAGEVYKTKTFIRSKGSTAAWELIDDTVLKESDYRDILIDTGSIDVKQRIGIFRGQHSVDNYWSADLMQRQNANVIIDPPTFVSQQTLTYDSGSYLFDSMCINSDTVTTYPQQFVRVYTSGSLGVNKKTFEKNGQYELTLTSLGVRSTNLGSGRAPYIEFYISGSAFSPKKDDFGLGKKIGEIDVDKLMPGSKGNTFKFENKTFNVEANNDGDGLLVLKVNAGDWYISNLSLIPSTELGFNPCQSTTLIALPTEHQNDQLDFKIEYYDFENNQSKFISYCDACDFAGGNTYIGGVRNLLTGSLFVGNGTGSGVEINGIVGGFVRSVGYTGFNSASLGTGAPGFAIWSGSGLSSESNEDYNGVGLELHAGGSSGSFKFRTYPSALLEVITPSFFFGDPTSAYLSGSNGNIEISSSNFWLKPEGQVTASGLHIVNATGDTMFDSAGQFADLLNLGRIWAHDDNEYSALATTRWTSSTYVPDNGTLITSGSTFILPGENTINLDMFVSASNNDVLQGNYRWKLFFRSGSINNTYDNWSSGSIILQNTTAGQNLAAGVSSVQRIDSNSPGVGRVQASTTVAKFQGKLVKWEIRLWKTDNTIPALQGEIDVKFKHIIIRSSRALGSKTSSEVDAVL